MIQEIDSGNPELYLLAFRDLEVLKQREIAVKVCRTPHIRPNESALLPVRRRTEAVGIEVQPRSVVPRIADHLWQNRIEGVRPKPSRRIHPIRLQPVGQGYVVRARETSWPLGIEVPTEIRLEGSTSR